MDKDKSWVDSSILNKIMVNVKWEDIVDLIEQCRKDPDLDPRAAILRFAFAHREPLSNEVMTSVLTGWTEGITSAMSKRNDLIYRGLIFKFREEELASPGPLKLIGERTSNLDLWYAHNFTPVKGGVLENYTVRDLETDEILFMSRFPFERVKPASQGSCMDIPEKHDAAQNLKGERPKIISIKDKRSGEK